MKPDRPTFAVTFRAEPGADPIRALRALLKAALRRYHLKCITVRELKFSHDEKIKTAQKGHPNEPRS